MPSRRLMPSTSRLLLRRGAACAALAACASFALAQDQEKDPPAVDQAAVDAAVAKGSEWLRARLKAGLPAAYDSKDRNHSGNTYDEIVLYALVHAGVNRGDPGVIKLVNAIRAKPPVRVYTAALRAMAFELYDPVKLRAELVMSAQFLVDNQGQNGQWGYGQAIEWPALPPVLFTASSKPPIYTLAGSGAGPSAMLGAGDGRGAAPGPAAPASAAARASGTVTKRPPPRYPLTRRGWGAPHDNSNAQYALLGLRACMAQGIAPPSDCLSLAEKWFGENQNDDGGWCYQRKGSEPSYGSITAGGLSSLAVCIGGTRRVDPSKDPRVQKGVAWMAKNLGFGGNPGDPANYWHYYWIYGVERAGALLETEWFGGRPWYHEGATWLLKSQNADGTWGSGSPTEQILDTSWAILFLRRATRHIARKKVIYTQ